MLVDFWQHVASSLGRVQDIDSHISFVESSQGFFKVLAFASVIWNAHGLGFVLALVHLATGLILVSR